MHTQPVSLRSHVAVGRFSVLALVALLVGLLFPFLTTDAHAQTATGGTVVAWGDNSGGQANVPAGLNGVTAIAAGDAHSLALKADGTVVAWGSNTYGQTTVPAGLSDVTAIAAGGGYSLALKSDGTVVAWGNNAYGQATVPAGLSGVTAIAAGWSHSLALKRDGTVVAWGDNTVGQLNIPGDLAHVKVSAISAKWGSNVALASDGTVFEWGRGAQNVPAEVNAAKNVTAIADGQQHALALTRDGTVTAWGDNGSGQTNVPAGLTDVTAIAADYNASLALKRDGTVVAWGDNSSGQTNVPTGLSGVTAIAAGESHILALVGSATPPTITHSASIEVVGAPCSAVPDALENDQFIRLFPEHLAYKLPGDITVTAPNGSSTVIAKGTPVDSYLVHADWVNNGQNAVKVMSGNITFAQPVLGTISDATGLVASDPIVGVPGTTYGTNSDRGLESYDDSAIWSNNDQTLNLKLSVWNADDEVRIITAASPSITHSDSVEVIGAPCSAVENTLESDSAIRMFPERLNYALPSDLTVNGTLLAAGTKVNVYTVHADRLGDQPGVMKKLSGSVTFDTPVLAVMTKSADLIGSDSTLGATQDPSVSTSYSTRSDRGLESDDGVKVSANQRQVNLTFTVWNQTDDVRVITLAP